MGKIIIVSNRLPIKISEENGEFVYLPSEGGLATGLSSVCNEVENVWIGWPGLEVPDLEKQMLVCQHLKNKRLYPVFLSQEDISEYYEGFSNGILWPIFHYYASTYTNYQESNWDFYKSVNQKFRDAVLKIAEPGDTIWIHDYQLLLLPGLIRAENPDLSIGFFLHIPFPSYEMFRLIPWRVELLEGLVGADLLGFHTYDDVQHFLNTSVRILPIKSNSNILTVDDRPVVAEAFPMGIDFEKYASLTKNKVVKKELRLLKQNFIGKKVILSVDRLDYSKGILQRIAALERLFELYPEYIGQFVIYMIVVPSRDTVPQYIQLKDQIDKLVSKLNSFYRSMYWAPILYFYRSFSIESLSALYQVADVCLVTPMRDGMNLVSKEYVASRVNNDGVLILSEMAGASKELIDAIIVNPNNIGELTDAMVKALNMSEVEQKINMREMRKVVSHFNVFHWVKIYMEKLDEVKELQSSLKSRYVSMKIKKAIRESYLQASKRIIFLDYDGTLVDFNTNINKASPDQNLFELLDKLSSDKLNKIVLVSGRDHHKMNEWFKNRNVDMIAEHGVWNKKSGGHWSSLMGLTDEWKEDILPILNTYVERTPGAFIEEKSFSLVWHYRKTPKGLGDLRASELINNLEYLIKDKGLHIIPGNKVLEIKHVEVNKGKAVMNHLLKENFDFVMAIGDDYTDEDIFRVLPESSYTIKVGTSTSLARFYLRNTLEVRQFLFGICSDS